MDQVNLDDSSPMAKDVRNYMIRILNYYIKCIIKTRNRFFHKKLKTFRFRLRGKRYSIF